MTIKVNNLYEHADKGFYCLLSDDAPMKDPTTDNWRKGVIYTGTDGKLRSTTLERWKSRFAPVAEYTGDDEAVIAMVRRANPGSVDFDPLAVFESWHESEMAVTGHALEIAIAATMERLLHLNRKNTSARPGDSWSIDLTTEQLQRVLQTYEIERVPIPGGFKITLTK